MAYKAHCCRIEESSIINIILTCDIYSSSYIVNCADKYKLQINRTFCSPILLICS